MPLTDLMIDLETLDTLPTATILTIGAVKFDPYGDEINNPTCESLYVRVDIDSCDKLGCTVSDSTIEWWSRQSKEAQYEAFDAGNRVDIAYAMHQLYKFARGTKNVWSHGSCFDVIMCEELFRKTNRAIPWKYYNVRDTRTLFDLGIKADMPEITAHDALADALNQAVAVQGIFRKLQELGLTR